MFQYGKIATQCLTFLLLPVYTAFLSNEEYGVVDLLNTLVGLLLPISTLQIEQGLFRFLIDTRGDKNKETKIITTVIKFFLIQIFIYIIIFAVSCRFINNNYKYFLVGNLIAGIFSSILLQVCRGLGDNRTYACSSFILGASTVGLNIIFIVGFKMGAYGLLLATFFANIISIIYVYLKKKLYEYIRPKYSDKDILKDILKYSMPLVPNIISWWIVDASDRTIISTVLSIAQNGIYSAANKFSGAFISLYSVFNITWTESASVNIKSPDKDKFFSKIYDFVIRFFGCSVILIITYLPFVFKILINGNFSESYYQIPILMIGAMFNILVSFLGAIYTAKKLTKEIAKTSIIAAIINITINVLLIKKTGLYAASISTVIAYFVMFLYRRIDSKKYVKLNTNKPLVIGIIIITIISMMIYYINNLYLKIVLAIVVTIYVIVVNQKSVKFIIKFIKTRQI